MVIDGPFLETKERIAGFKCAPFDGGAELESRPVFEADDFGAEYTPGTVRAGRAVTGYEENIEATRRHARQQAGVLGIRPVHSMFSPTVWWWHD